VLLGAVGNAFAWNVRQFGRERATQVLDEALRLQREGRGRELMLVDLGPLGKALYSADHLVSLRGPQTRSDPSRNIAQVTAPVLLVYAGADRLVDLETSRTLRSAATRSARADLVEIAGADRRPPGQTTCRRVEKCRRGAGPLRSPESERLAVQD
jgi:alpha-beta hydrolase superfamily lysophospholipase